MHYSRSKHASRQCMRDITESFYQDYTGGHMGGVGTGVATKGWGARHGTDIYLGNALCNLAHDPGAPHSVDKKSLLRNISNCYSRSLMRSRSAVSSVLYNLVSRTPGDLIQYNLVSRTPGDLILYNLVSRTPGDLILYNLVSRTPGDLKFIHLIQNLY